MDVSLGLINDFFFSSVMRGVTYRAISAKGIGILMVEPVFRMYFFKFCSPISISNIYFQIELHALS